MAKRKTAGKKTTKPPPAPRPAPVEAGVRVRMYRQGLGDCFLLAFPRDGGGEFHLLIDCGVVLGTKQPQDIMQEVAKNLAQATGGRLDVVVATHEHWDHLSGFLQAREEFDKFQIGEVWFAWTEDPADDLAGRLREGRRQALKALTAVQARLTSLRAQDAADRVGTLLGFFGAAGGQTTRDALNYLAAHPSRPRVRYLKPGEPPLPLPAAGGARAFVLGPPHDETLLKRSNPTRTGKEVYELAADAETAFLAAAQCLEDDADAARRLAEQTQAFEPRFRLAAEKAGVSARRYADPSEGWRRIDNDWLSGADRLALNLDSDTNNTSLALAFELGGGQVLLFPGDAQVGNWLSWQNCSWPAAAGAPAVTAADLLRRTVLYKVGHHASHNATLRSGGLELMDSPDLVALVPVDHEMAVKKRWPGMPFPPLLDRLLERARGRVLRVDAAAPQKPADVAQALWDEFRGRVTEDELYFDYHVNS